MWIAINMFLPKPYASQSKLWKIIVYVVSNWGQYRYHHIKGGIL